jgi:hypothetical protein
MPGRLQPTASLGGGTLARNPIALRARTFMTNPQSGRGDAPDRDPWLRDAGRTVRALLPTRRHAEMLFDALVHELGDRAYVVTANGGAHRWVFQRDRQHGEWIVPWPVLDVVAGPDPSTYTSPWVATDPDATVPLLGETRRSGAPPKLRGLGRGSLTIHDGRIHVEFGEDGRVTETCIGTSGQGRPAQSEPVEPGRGHEIERLAARIAAADAGRLGPARVQLPVPLPGGPAGKWSCATGAIRAAFWRGEIAGEAAWLAVDGYAGTAFGAGPTREGALERWRAAVRELRPRPPDPTPLPAELAGRAPGLQDDGSILLFAPSPVDHGPVPSPENTPCALIPLPPLPARPCPYGSWVRLLDDKGSVCHGARVSDERTGFTLIGEDVLGTIPLDELERRLEAADRADEPVRRRIETQLSDLTRAYRCQRVSYAPHEDGSGRWVVSTSSLSESFHARDLDGRRLRAQVTRLTWRS